MDHTLKRRAKFSTSPSKKLEIAIAAAGGENISQLAREHRVSRPTIHAWRKQLLSRHTVQAVFGDHIGRGTFADVRDQRDELRKRLRSGTRKQRGFIEKRAGMIRCPRCGRWTHRNT